MKKAKNNSGWGILMGLMIKTFWISLVGLSVLGIIVLGTVGIPAKPITITKTIPNDRLPQ
jgi:hypothetical protein